MRCSRRRRSPHERWRSLGARAGSPHLEHHIENVRQFGVPVVVAINRFMADTEAELSRVNDYAGKLGVRVVLCEVWEKGGAGRPVLKKGTAPFSARGKGDSPL